MRRGLAGLAGLALAALLLCSCSGSGPTTGETRSTTPPADVLILQMFSADTGVAVVTARGASGPAPCCAGPRRGPDDLAATHDGGRTWRVTGELPARFNAAQFYGLHLAFSSPDQGYVQTLDPAPSTVFTEDGGRTWTSLAAPGQPTAMSLAGQALWIISNFCPTATTSPELCPSRLLSYRRGQSAPMGDEPIPTEGIVASKGIAGTVRAATLLDRLGSDSAVVEEGSEGSPSSLLLTVDGGRQWTQLSDPCPGLVPAGLVAPGPMRWDLYCQLDGGMNQGETAFYATGNGGRTWTLTAAANEQGDTRGTLGDGMADDLTLSSNGAILWLLGTVGGIKSSSDGGLHWTDVSLQTGGYATPPATAGATDAWVAVPGVGLYASTDGTRWRRLR